MRKRNPIFVKCHCFRQVVLPNTAQTTALTVKPKRCWHGGWERWLVFLAANCFNLINWHYWSIQMKTNRVWGRSWLPHLQKVLAAHCFQVPQLNRQSFHGPLESHTSTEPEPVNPHPSNGPHSLVHFILSEQEMISWCRLGSSWAEMCTKRDRAKLINSGTLSVDFINIDVCAATLFFCIFFPSLSEQRRPGQKITLCVQSLLFKESKKTHAFVFICQNKHGSHQNISVWRSAFF